MYLFALVSRTLNMCFGENHIARSFQIFMMLAHHFFIFFFGGCFASTSLHVATAFQISVLCIFCIGLFVGCEYLTVFFRFVILFAWAVIIDAVQFTSYTVVHIQTLTQKSHKISRLLRWQRISNATFAEYINECQQNEREKTQLPNEKKIGLYFLLLTFSNNIQKNAATAMTMTITVESTDIHAH